MKRGFSLIEVLVGLAVLALFTLALLAFTQGTLAANGAARTQARLGEELKDAAGYLADTLQEARLLLNSQTSLSLNGKPCAFPACLAVLVPEDGGTCALRAYRLEARRDVPDPYKSPDPWADGNAAVLQEYRLSGLSCGSATSFTASGFPLLDLVDPGISPFALVSSPRPGVDVTLRLKARSGNRAVYAPGPGAAYALRVYPRNLP
jgi:prepilin-type N-terminal cleavage/methylation domain-containing protein